MNIFKEIFNNPIYDQTNNMVRWNGLSRIKDETVAQHTYIVTLFSRIIFEEVFSLSEINESIRNIILVEILTYALFHDFDESFTGDILHNFKHNSFNGDKFVKHTNEYLNEVKIDKFNSGNPTHDLISKYAFDKNVSKLVKNIVKLADWLSMTFYIKKEIMLGNKNVENQFKYCIEESRKQCELLINHLEFNYKDKNYLSEILNDLIKTNFYE
jgi:5'-deoxynucleotidase YfbR-like HD superfamily hydrolase